MTPAHMTRLVRAAQAGDGAAFGALYASLLPKVRNYLRARLHGRPEDIADLADGAFLKVLEALPTFDVQRGTPFTSWVYAIAHNLLLDYYAARSRAAQAMVSDGTDVAQVADPTAEQALADVLTDVDTGAPLRDALPLLTPPQREVVELRWLEDQSVAQTAAALGKREDAVKQLQRTAFRRLREHLADGDADEADEADEAAA